ncbi:MAG: methyltransferase domain-containing protein [Nitrosomonadales bacterium]|nr:methyltransferase domain-containing protein [Nitrosomonadales bacterium]
MSTAKTLHDWFATPQGEYLLTREQEFFDKAVADLFGFHAVQLGLTEYEFLRASRMPLRTVAGNRAGLQACKSANGDKFADYEKVRLVMDELPFDGGSLDLVVMPHVLEFNEHPHQILREVERVLVPEGHVIIAGFNPRSLWGVWHMLGKHKGYPWNGNFISLPRMKDWLALLGFEVVAGRFACYAPPLSNTKWLSRFHFMEPAGDRWWAVCGGVYFLQAIKRVPGMRPLKPSWNEGLVGKLLPAAPRLNNRMPQKTGVDPQ